jgi:hypothetical protein
VLNANGHAIRARTVQKASTRANMRRRGRRAGPLCGAEVAQMLGVREVIVPPYPASRPRSGC